MPRRPLPTSEPRDALEDDLEASLARARAYELAFPDGEEPPDAHPGGLAGRLEAEFRRPPEPGRKRRRSPGQAPRDWPERFLRHLKGTGNVTYASRMAGVDRRTAQLRKRNDTAFARAWDDALEQFADGLERVSVRLATVGTLDPVVSKGEIVCYRRKFYPQLLLANLRRLRPDEWAERREVRHTGSISTPATSALSALLQAPEMETARVQLERVVVEAVRTEAAARALPDGEEPPAEPPANP